MAKLQSGKVKKTPSSEVSSTRYDFIELAETEPDLGLPSTSGQVLSSDTSGNRTWVGVAYTHTQGVASNSWAIAHNLNFYPNLTVQDSAGNIVEGEINYIDKNSLEVSFSAAFSGKAYLS